MVFLRNEIFGNYLLKLDTNSYFNMNETKHVVDGNYTFSNETVENLIGNGDLRWGLLAVSVIIFCTTVGNLLVCLAVMWDRRLQNMTNYFLMSLAIADFLVSLLVMPFGMIVEMFGYFPLQAEFCVFWVTMDVLMCTASIWHMCTMSMDRYFTLKYPMRYGRNKTKMMVAMKILFVWAVSITISSPICIFGIKDTGSVLNEGLCVPTIKDFVIYGSVFAFYIPLTIMLITYVLTIRILWKNQVTMRKIERSDFRPMTKCHSNGRYAVKTLLSPPSYEGSRRISSALDGSDTEASFVAVSMNSPLGQRSTIEDMENQLSRDTTSIFENSTLPNGKIQDPQCSFIRPEMFKSSKRPISQDSSVEDNPESIHSCDSSTSHQHVSQDEQISGPCNIPPHTITISQASLSPTHSSKEHSFCVDKSNVTLEQKAASMSNLQSSSNEFQNCKSTKLNQNQKDHLSPKADNFLRVNSNLALPIRHEKPGLQAAASFSTVPQCRSEGQRLSRFNGVYSNSCSNIDKTDYKFSEWKQHYFQIQKEMDQILKDSEKEKKQKPSPCSSPGKENTKLENSLTDSKPENSLLEIKPENSLLTSSYHSSSNYLCIDSPSLASDSAESLDDMEDTSSNNSDLITIKLQPTSLHMYKLNLDQDPSTALLQKSRNGHYMNGYCNGLDSGHKRTYGLISRSVSDRSVRSSKAPSKSSIHNLLKQFNKTQGKRQLLSKRANSNERKASKVLGIIFAVFVILWTPFFTVNIMSVTCPDCMSNTSPTLMSVFLWMGYVASLANPIIYTMFNTAFRRAFVKILKCHLCKNGSLHSDSTGISYALSNNPTVGNDRRNTMVHLLKDDGR